jgi:hypothetical protein
LVVRGGEVLVRTGKPSYSTRSLPLGLFLSAG